LHVTTWIEFYPKIEKIFEFQNHIGSFEVAHRLTSSQSILMGNRTGRKAKLPMCKSQTEC
jgi:hypothetical protein